VNVFQAEPATKDSPAWRAGDIPCQALRRSLLFSMLLCCWLVPAASASANSDDRIVIVGPVLVDRGETVGDVVVLDGDVTIRGTVKGDVIVGDGDVTIRGTVKGDVVAAAGQATLGRRGRISGDLIYGDERPVLAPGSRVGGDVQKVDAGDVSIVGAIGAWIALVVSMFVLGLLFLLLAPRAAEAVARTARGKALVCALVGLLGFFLLPVLAVAALFTIVGIPLGVVLLFLVIPLYAMGYVTSALVVGRLILKKSRILAFLLGLVILGLLTLIPIAGGIIGFLAIVFGLGALLVTLFRSRS
jgi:accessory gene regulator protein AgrB